MRKRKATTRERLPGGLTRQGSAAGCGCGGIGVVVQPPAYRGFVGTGAGGIGIILSGGRRCWCHPNRDERGPPQPFCWSFHDGGAPQWSSTEGMMPARSFLVVYLFKDNVVHATLADVLGALPFSLQN